MDSPMLYIPSDRDLRSPELRSRGQRTADRLVATRALAWQIAFRRWFRPPIKVIGEDHDAL